MEREYKTWSEIEDIIIAHIRECPIRHRFVNFEFLFEDRDDDPYSFDLETEGINEETHMIFAEYIARLIETLEEIYRVVPNKIY